MSIWGNLSTFGGGGGGGGGGAEYLTDLGDVGISSPADGQLLKYNGTTHKWQNVSGSGWVSVTPTNATTATWTQYAEQIVFFVLYWNAYQLWSVWIGKDNAIYVNRIAANGNVGGDPSFSYNSGTHTVTARWPATNYAKIMR